MRHHVGIVLVMSGCADVGEHTEWYVEHEHVSGALMSVWGTSSEDMWIVGADALDGTGPTVLHFDGLAWERVLTGQPHGDLWWVHGFDDGPVYMGGAGGTILRYEGGAITPMATPGRGTVFGIWGATPADVWAVGGESESFGGFAWRLDGDAWTPEPTVPATVANTGALWKVRGASERDAWIVGSNGAALHWDGSTLTPGDTGVGSSLFTVHEHGGRYAAVGGTASGFIIENDGTGWINATPDPAPMGLAGVTLGDDGIGIAVGLFGGVYVRNAHGWQHESLGDAATDLDFHGSWIDDDGGLWAVGGHTLSPPFTDGIVLRRAAP